MWKKLEYLWKENPFSKVTRSCGEKNIISENANTAFITCAKKLPIILPLILLSNEFSSAQETLNVPSYYGGTGINNQAVQSNNLQTQQQNSIQNYQNLVSNIQINQGLISQLSESNEVVANPNTGEVRTVGTNDPTPSGWMRLDVTPTANGYTLGNNSQGGQFSYSIQSQPTMTQFQPSTVVNPNTFQVANSQQQTPSFTYNPNTVSANGAQTTVTNNSQTTVGNTTTESLADGSTVTSTPTETVDQQVTTIVTPDSETIITETTTTTVTESLIQGPTIITEGGGATYATQATPVQQASQVQQATQAQQYTQPVNSNAINQSGTMTAVATPPLVMNETGGNTVMATPTPPVINNAPPQATFYTAPNSAGSQTTITNNTQTNVGETTSQTLGNGTTITETPTETIDTTVTTTTTPNSQTIITETVTTNTIDGVIETPATVITTGSPAVASNTTNGTVITPVPDVNMTPTTSGAVPVPYPASATTNDTGTGSTKETVDNTEIAVQGSGLSNGTTSSPTFELGGGETETTGIQQDYNLSEQPQEIDVGLNIQQEECQGPDCPPTNTEGGTPSIDNDTSINTASDENEATGGEETNVADASNTSDTEGDTSDATEEGEGAGTTDSSSPATVMANNVNSSSGMSQAEREAAAARAAEEERRRREEYIRMQQEASNLRQGSQNRAMALLENDNTAMMGAASGQMGNSSGMMDPNRMSIFTQNARLTANNSTANVSGQIASLSNTVASVNQGIDDNEAMLVNLFAPCPILLAGACEEAANRIADDLEKEIQQAEEEGEQQVNEELDGAEENLNEEGDRADDEKDRRDKRSPRQRAIDELEERQRQRAEELSEEGEELKERGDEQQERRARLEQEERDLRKAEQEARRNGDPNCRGAECRAIREQRAANSRATTELARDEGRFQADQARHQGQVQGFQRDQARLDEMRQGDPVYEAQRMRNEAHRSAARIQSEVDRLKEEQLNLRRQGGSGSRQDRAYDRAIERAERAAQAAANDAQIADRLALKAEFYEAGMQDQWKDYENARKAADAFNNYLDANNEATDLRERASRAQDALNGARQNPDFDPDSLADLESEVESLRDQLSTAEDAVKRFAGDIGNSTEQLTGKPLPVTNATSRQISETLGDISTEFAERQRLSNLSDAQLANEIDMINEAKERVAAARNGLGGSEADPGGPHTQRYNALRAEQSQLRENMENFNPTGVDGRPVIGAAEAYRDMANRLNEVEGELSGMKSIAAASNAVELVDAHNQWADGLTEGLPMNADGTINRQALTQRVGEMAEKQVNLLNANRNLDAAKANLSEAQASGDAAAIESAQSRVSQYNDVVNRITDQLADLDVNINVNSEGGFAISTDSVGASAIWAAAAESVSKTPLEQRPPSNQIASAAGTVPAGNSSGQITTNTNNASGTNGRTSERIVEVASDPVVVSEPPIAQPGGFFQSIIDAANDLSKQAQHGAAVAVASTTKPKKSIAKQHELVANTTQEARERRGQARTVENQIDRAKFDAELAQNEAEFQRSQANEYVETRERQADEYVNFADNAEARADKNRTKAEELENQAEDLRRSAERFNTFADSTDDKSLARDAREAARNNLEDAEKREKEAEGYREEAGRDDVRATELTAKENEIRDDAESLETRASNAEAEAERAKAEVVKLEAEAARLNSEAAKLDQLATNQANDLAETQRKAFNELINNPPEGWRWSSLDSTERSNWLRENIPQWNTLNTDQRIEFLEKLELGEAANDFKAQNARYEEFNNSSQGQRSTKEMLESRQRDLVNMDARLKELNDMTFWNDEEEAEAKRLKEGLETGTARLRADQRARNTEEMLRYEAWQEANRKLWAVNDEKRAEEVQRHVDAYADAQSQVGNARNIQEARSAAFDTREAAINNRINNPTSAADAEVARGELTRLKEARKYWADFDARTVAGSEAIAAEVRREITHYGTMNGLGEIGFEDNLEERANAKLSADTALNNRRQGTATSIQTAVNGIDFTEPDPTVWESIITGYDVTTKSIENTAVGISSGVGALYGVGKGTVKAFVGLADMLVIQTLDTYYETLQLHFNEATGLNIDIVGSENLDAINNMGEASWGELGMKFVIGEGKKISDGLDRLDSAYQTGSLSDAFTGSSEVTAVGAELFADPAMVIGGGGKIITVLRGLDRVDELAQAANIVDDVARGANAVGDVSRGGTAASDLTRGADVVGDSVRFTDNAKLPEATGGAYQGFDELMGPEFANAFGTTPRAPVYPPARPSPLRPGAGTGSSTPLPPRDAPYVGLDELLGPEFAGALDTPLPAGRAAPDGLPYQGFDELMGPEFANAFGGSPRPPVYPPASPAPLRPGAGAGSAAPLPPRDGPFIGFDELMGPEFAGALDGPVPATSFTPDGLPYQGLDELLGPQFANAFGGTPRPPVYPPVRPSPIRPGPATPSAPLAPRDGPLVGFDELMGPEFARAFDDVPNLPRDPAGMPYQGLDEILGPEFAQALGEVPKAPVYPPARPSPLRPGGAAPSTPLPPRDGPFIGLDEMLGPEFRNAFDEPLPIGSRNGPGGTTPLNNGPNGTQALAGGNGGAIPPSSGGGAAIPPSSSGGILPTRAGAGGATPTPANSNAPLAVGESGIPVNLDGAASSGRAARAELGTLRDGAPVANNPGIPPTNAPGARPAPSAANSNSPLIAGEAGSSAGAPSIGNQGPNGTLFDGPAGGAADNLPVAPSGTDVGQLPAGVFRTADGGLMQVPQSTAPVVNVKQAGNFVVLEDAATGARQILEVGPEIGRGSFTVVNDLAGRNRGNVVKVSQQVDPVTARLDNVGTQAFTDLPKSVRDNFVYTPEPRGEFRVAAANDNGALAGKNIRIAEKAPVPTYSQTRGARTPMTPDEVTSISRAQDLVNEGGHVVLDLKSNNFGFEDLPNGLKRTVVHDAGGTVPTVGGSGAERAANAKTIQRALMSPDQTLVDQFKQAMNAYDSYKVEWARARAAGDNVAAEAAKVSMNNAGMRAFDITSGHGRSVLERYGHLIDEASLGVPLDEIGFNPVLGFNQDGVRAAAQAAAANDNFTGLTNVAFGGF